MYLEYCHWTQYEYIVRENHIASLSKKPNTQGTEIIAFQSSSERRLQNLCSRKQINHALILLLCRVWDYKYQLSRCKRYIQDKLERSNMSNSYVSPSNYRNLSSQMFKTMCHRKVVPTGVSLRRVFAIVNVKDQNAAR